MNTSRLPSFTELNLAGMNQWFSDMAELGLLFHPDDSPQDIVSIKTGQQLFTECECSEINRILDEMFSNFGDDVYEAAYIEFMKKLCIHH